MRLFPFNVNRIISFIMNFLKSYTGFALTVELIIIGILGSKDFIKVRHSKVMLTNAIQRSLESWIDLDAFSYRGLQNFDAFIEDGDWCWRQESLDDDVSNITVAVIKYSWLKSRRKSLCKPFSFNSSATAKVSTKIDVPPTTDLSFCRHNRYWSPGADSI